MRGFGDIYCDLKLDKKEALLVKEEVKFLDNLVDSRIKSEDIERWIIDNRLKIVDGSEFNNGCKVYTIKSN